MKRVFLNAIYLAVGLTGEPIFVKRFRNQTNATAIEYGIITIVIAFALFAVVKGFGLSGK